jgi:L-ribulose-5-phosphate 4-epimerase
MSHYVKFTYQRARVDIAPFDALAALNAYRQKLLEQRLIGVDSNDVGFGNLSIRDGVTENFYITGSATGGLPELTMADCVRVVAYDFAKNWLRYEGAAIPSSESLTHAAKMAYEIMRLFNVNNLRRRQMFVMAGHEGGIVTFGKDLQEAFAVLMRERKASCPCIENSFHERISARHER